MNRPSPTVLRPAPGTWTSPRFVAGEGSSFPPAPAHTVPVLRQAIRVIEELARCPRGATAKSLAITLSIPPTTCYRILRSFVAAGWLRTSAGGTFALANCPAPVPGGLGEPEPCAPLRAARS